MLNTLPLFLAGAIVLASRLDVALFFTSGVSGQILISLRIDRFDWFEIPMPP
ncbi:MAG: DMT family transporter [SAR324 cluster bacterium]|nr:DMT family transporter [SAR324 cluster bacterium]